MKKIIISTAAFCLALGASNSVFATNGMNLEGYGPIALGMGGASFAYDNGTAGSMNNPATIGLSDGHRFDIAIGFLGPDVDASVGGMTASSSADAFYMPAMGWTSKKGDLGYGLTIFGQGGMGTEYDGNSFMAAGSGETVRSEVSLGRLMVPVTYDVNDKLVLGGTADLVWAGMDMKMAMTGSQFGDMVAALGGSQTIGTASGTMVNGLVASMPSIIGGVNWVRFDFSNGSDFTGEAKGYGVAGKIGLVYKVNPSLSLGATYHSKTALGDLKTDNATVSMNALVDTSMSGRSYSAMTIPITGEIKIKDFQWPDTFGVGVSYKATNKLMFATDVKYIRWSGTMDNLTMSFTADANQSNPLAAGFAGADLSATLFQDWDDQTVIEVGLAYDLLDNLTLRAGYNYASNPIPDEYLNALFPAIVESHVTAGAGVKFGESSSVNFAASMGLDKEQTSTTSGVTSDHRQFSWQLMYTFRY